MPYKHIAAQLKKTELACRLHYHQLTHGSNRRKRAVSCSSVSSHQSFVMPVTAPSPIRPVISRSTSPTESHQSYGHASTSSASGIQLPSILAADESPRLPAILPKPLSMSLAPPMVPMQNYAAPTTDRYMGHRQSQSIPTFHQEPPHHPATPPLRLDCSALPPPSVSSHTSAHVDLSRLHAVYSSYRDTFWATIANEYGPNSSPTVLEQAWRTGVCCNPRAGSPITPAASPDNSARVYQKAQDKTRISSILGIDADPRTARDRDIVRRMEEERLGMA